jgi:hypothetical protein
MVIAYHKASMVILYCGPKRVVKKLPHNDPFMSKKRLGEATGNFRKKTGTGESASTGEEEERMNAFCVALCIYSTPVKPSNGPGRDRMASPWVGETVKS